MRSPGNQPPTTPFPADTEAPPETLDPRPGDRARRWLPLAPQRTAIAPQRTAIAVVSIIGLYLASRVWFISHFPYFSDEGIYASWIDQGAGSLHALFVSESGAREPLLIWLGIPWVKLGLNPLVAVRLVSVMAGLLTIPVVGLLGWRLGGPAVAWAAAALCVVLPMFVVHDGIGIEEPLVTLIMATALYLQIELAQRPRLRTGAQLGVVFGAAVLTKQSTEPAIALLPVSLLCFDFSPGARRRLSVWLASAALSLIGVLAAELLLRSSHYYSALVALRKTHYYTVRSLSAVLADPFGSITAHNWSVFRSALVGYVTIPLLTACAVGVVWLWRSSVKLTLVLLAWILVPFATALWFSTYPFPRHVMYVLPPAIVMMAFGGVRTVCWVQRKVPPRARVAAGLACIALLLVPSLLFDGRMLAHPATFRYPSLDDFQYVTGFPAGSQWPAVTDAIRRRGKGARVVILTPNAIPLVPEFLLPRSRYIFVKGTSPLAPSAQFAVNEAEPGGPFIDVPAQQIVADQHFVLIRRFVRPRPCSSWRPLHMPPCPKGGDALLLYERPVQP